MTKLLSAKRVRVFAAFLFFLVSLPALAVVNVYSNVNAPSSGSTFKTNTNVVISGDASGAVFCPQGGDCIEYYLQRIEIRRNGTYIGNATLTLVQDDGFPQYTWTYTDNVATAGSYTYSSLAIDGSHAQGTPSATKAINYVANLAPTVNLTPANGTTVTGIPSTTLMQATASDADGSITSLNIYANGSLYAQCGPVTTCSQNYVAGYPTTVTFRADAVDNSGATTSATSVLTFVTGNAAQYVTQSVPGTLQTGQVASTSVTFSNTGSSTWTPGPYKVAALGSSWGGSGFVALPQSVAPGGSVTVPITITAPSTAGTYTYQWMVIQDNVEYFNQASPATSIVVSAPSSGPVVSITSPSNGATVGVGSLNLVASASSSQGISTVRFYEGATLLGTGTGSGGSYSLSISVTAGTHTYTAVATDTTGASTTSSAVTITASSAGNLPPTVSIVSPANGSTVPAGTVQLQASASDDRGIANVKFYEGSTQLGTATLTGGVYVLSATGVAAGSHTYTAVATDTDGATTTSSPITITASSAARIAITSPADGTSSAAPTYVTLVATPSAGVSVSSVQFYEGGFALGNGTGSGSTFSLALGSVPVGSHTYTAVATETSGGTSTSLPITITVTEGSISSITVPNANNADAGTLPGALTVGVDGAAKYSVPIEVPPGTVGVVPQLTLDYSSAAGDGLQGRGWTLGGLGSIERCARTIAQEGYAGAINLDTNDRYCFQGQHLILVSGTYGGAAEYRTEVDSFAQIKSFGSNPSKGPDRWEVRTKDGYLWPFGSTTDSTIEAQSKSSVVLRWLLSRKEDHQGNYFTVSYDKSGNATDGSVYPLQISYTGNSNAYRTPYNAVRFVYESSTRPDPVLHYVGGSKQTFVKRLVDIQTVIGIASDGTGGTLVRDYRIGYSLSPSSGRSLIASVGLYGPSGTLLIPLTQFTWQQRQASDNVFQSVGTRGAPPIAWNGNQGHSITAVQTNVIFGDFNGDGIQDLAQSDGSGNWTVCLGSPTGFNCQTWAGPTKRVGDVMFGDFNGDGKLDIADPNFSGDSTTWRVCLSTGAGFNCQNWSGLKAGLNAKMTVGDFTGDGRDDIIQSTGAGGVNRLCASTGTSFACFTCTVSANPAMSLHSLHPHDYLAAHVIRGDFNGDGRADTASFPYSSVPSPEDQPAYWTICTAGDTGFTCRPWSPPIGYPDAASIIAALGNTMVADLTEDGLSDLVTTFTSNSRGQSGKICRSNGFALDCADIPTTIPVGAFGYWNLGDYDGSGRAQMLFFDSGTNLWTTCQPRVQGVPCNTWTGMPGFASNRFGPFSGDFDGDGKLDLAVYNDTTGQWEFYLSQGPVPDQLVAVVNGLGAKAEVTYKPLTNATVYAADSSSTYPSRDVVGSARVVSQLRTDNALGGWLSTDFRYGGKKTDLLGRGDLGFRWIEATDNVSHVVTRNERSQTFPFTGLATLTRQTHVPSGCVLNNTTNTLAEYSRPSGSARFPYVSATAVAANELNGCASVFSMSVTGVSYDNYANVTGKTTTVVASGETFVTAETNTFVAPDESTWLVDLLQQRVVTNSAPIPTDATSNSVTRTTAFSYVSGTKLVSTMQEEPGNTAVGLQTSYLYDVSGNRTRLILDYNDSGTAINQQPWRATMDTLGRWPVMIQDAFGYLTLTNYSSDYGQLTSRTDINNLTTTWQYDALGRRIKETRPDGTSTTDRTRQCMSGCNGAVAVSITQDFATNGAAMSVASLTYADVLGRQVLNQTWGFDGVEIRSESQYDASGRLSSRARNHFATDAAPLTTYAYDDLGRNTSFTVPGDGATSIAYNGLATTTTNPKGQARTQVMNGMGRLKRATDPNGQSTTYAYDGFGDLIRTIDPKGNTIRATFDTRGRRTALNDPDLGNWSFTVNPIGLIRSQTDAKGQLTSFNYDAFNRVTLRIEPSRVVTWRYDPPNGAGKLVEAYIQTGVTKSYDRVYTYDTLSRPTSVVLSTDQDYATLYTYDATTGRLATERKELRASGASSGTGHTFTSTYNGYGYWKQVSEGTTSYWTANAQDALGRAKLGTAGNGVVTRRIYATDTARLVGIFGGPLATPYSVQNDSYAYDTVGNMTSRSQLGDSNGTLWQESFTHDPLNRLTTSQIVVGGATQSQKIFGYDEIGNITAKSGVGSYAYPASGSTSVRPHAVSGITGSVIGIANPTFGYDANGNTTSGVGRTYTWTSFDMIDTVTSGSGASTRSDSFQYGPELQRYKQTRSAGSPLAAVSTVYYADGFEKEMVGGVTTVRTYVPNSDVVVVDRTGGSSAGTSTLYRQLDHLGSVSVLKDQTGTVVERLGFDAWGLRRQPTGVDDQSGPPNNIKGVQDNKGFTEHEHLDDIELVHMNGRIYDPVTARFSSADPEVDESEETQDLNRYTYVLNGPLGAVDPSGYDRIECPTGNCADRVDVTGTRSAGDRSSPVGVATLIGGSNPHLRDRTQQQIDSFVDNYARGRLLAPVSGAAAIATALNEVFVPNTATDLVLLFAGPIGRAGRVAEVLGAFRKSSNLVGEEGEAAVRALYKIGDKPRKGIVVNGRVRRPDGLILGESLSEVKNVKSLSFTRQLRDYSEYAQAEGLRFDLYIRSGASLSGPLEDAINKGLINRVWFFP